MIIRDTQTFSFINNSLQINSRSPNALDSLQALYKLLSEANTTQLCCSNRRYIRFTRGAFPKQPRGISFRNYITLCK